MVGPCDKMVVASMMFSSTMQILEAYSSSPTSSVYSRFDRGEDEPQSSPLGIRMLQIEDSFSQYAKLVPSSPESSYRTSYSSQSAAESPASSATSAFSDSFQSQHKEIRRRRSPTNSEPRPKDLKLLSSNGATSLQRSSILASRVPEESSSPGEVPPPPPPKNVHSRPFAQKPPPTLQDTIGNRVPKPAAVSGIRREKQNPESSLIATASAVRLPPAPPLKLVVSREKSAGALLGSVESNPPKNFNFPNPRQGIRRPIHQKSISASSQNKPLPPAPPLPEQPFSRLPESNSTLAPREPKTLDLQIQIFEAAPVHSHSRGKSDTAFDILDSPSSGRLHQTHLSSLEEDRSPFQYSSLPLSDKTSASISRSDSLPAKIHPVIQPQNRLELLPSPSHGSSKRSIESSLTNASLPGPFSQPHLPAGPRLRTKTLSPPTHREVTTPQPIQAAKTELPQSSVPQQGISDILEVRNPMIASKLMPSHFCCYVQHKQLVPSSNASAPVLCMACDRDCDRMWKCGWCCLRICAVCKDVMGTVNGDLKRLIDARKDDKAEVVPIRMDPTDMESERSNTPLSLRIKNVPGRNQPPMSFGTRDSPDRSDTLTSLRTRVGPGRSETPMSLRAQNAPSRSGTPLSLRTRNAPERHEATATQKNWLVSERSESVLSFRTHGLPERSESSLSSRMRGGPQRSDSPINSSLRPVLDRTNTPMSLRIGNAVGKREQSTVLGNGTSIPDFDTFVPVFGPGGDLGMDLRGGRGVAGQRLMV